MPAHKHMNTNINNEAFTYSSKKGLSFKNEMKAIVANYCLNPSQISN